MVLKYLSIFIIIITLFSCEQEYPIVDEEDCVDYDYSDCNGIEPMLEYLKINLTIDNDNPKVLLTIYKGYIDKADTLFCDSIATAYYEIELALNQRYTVKVDYLHDNKIINAIDGTYLEKLTHTTCDSICWYTDGDKIDVRLKY